MAEIICLANSWKHGERCIAGINLRTKKWIRPVSGLDRKAGIPSSLRQIGRTEPALLDILEIPLENNCSDMGIARENITIAPGKWLRLGKIQPTGLLEYCQSFNYILHNSKKYVTVPFLESLPFPERRTLELVYTKKITVERIHKEEGMKWKGTFTTDTGLQLTEATITDPVFVKKLELSYRPQNPCLVTVSLSLPHRPPYWEGDDPCWKLITGVIELSNFDLILVEMKRIGWTIEQGCSYLKRNYHKSSRQQLDKNEMTEFLNYLQSLNNEQ